jgi:hypothetical protein
MRIHLCNIREVLRQADEIDRAEGMVSYLRYNTTLHRLAEYYDAPFEGTVAAFCALSPNNDYMGNLRSTATLLSGLRAGIPVEQLIVSTYNACRSRAWQFLNGESFLEVTKGPKTRNFYQNILDPSDPLPVTIDGHMVSLWYARRMTMVEAVETKFKYDELAKGFRQVAKQEGLLANQLQAILWFTWKRIHQVVYRPQLSLFRGDDQWGLNLDPAEIIPFTSRELTRVDKTIKLVHSRDNARAQHPHFPWD